VGDLDHAFAPETAEGTHNDGEVEGFARLVRKIAKGTAIAFVGSILGKGIDYTGQILFARLLGAEAFGLYALGITILNLSSALPRLGLDGAVLKYIPIYSSVRDDRKVEGTLITAVVLPLVAGSIIGAALFLGSGKLAAIINKFELEGVIKIFSLGVPLMSGLVVTALATRGFQKTQYYVYAYELFLPTAKILLFLGSYLLGFKLYGAVWAAVISTALSFVLAFSFLRRLFPQLGGKFAPIFPMNELLRFSFPVLMSTLASFVLLWVDPLMLGYFRSAREVGVYNAAFQTSLLFMMVSNALTAIFAPVAAELYYTNRLTELDRLFKIVTKWSLYLNLPIFLFLAFSAGDVMKLFGSEFEAGKLTLLILAGTYCLYGSLGQVGWVLMMCGRQNLWLYNVLLVSISKIIANIILLPIFGIFGAAISTAFALAILYLLGLAEVYHFLRLLPFDARCTKGVVIAIVASVFGVLFKSLVPSYLAIYLSGVFVAAGYLAMMLMWGLDKDEANIFEALRKRVTSFGQLFV